MNEALWIVALVLLGVFSGRFALSMMAGWAITLGLVGGAHVILLDADPIARMVGICVVLLAGMKALVYRVWGGRLSVGSYLVFALGWFGMDPGSFQKRRADLSWQNDVFLGGILMALGTLGAWWVWKMEWRQILVMFLPMSLGFHFGALRALKGVLRKFGFPVRTLFPNLLRTRGLADFWSLRWNVGYSQMMQRVVGRPVERRWGREWGIMAVFLASGLLHELAITLPVKAGYGLPTAYFAGHGLLVVLETKSGYRFGKVGALLLVMVPLGFLFPTEFQSEVIARCLMIFER